MAFFESFLEIFVDALLDTAKLLPFLFLTYLLLEFLEHRAGDATEQWLQSAGKVGPLVGGALGLLPQCGFSAAASGLYVGRVITAGTLIAVYLSTSDEMLPILLSGGIPVLKILLILGLKFAIGVSAGFVIDLIIRRKDGQADDSVTISHSCCDRHCKQGILVSSLFHTLKISLFLFVFSLLLGFGVSLIGEDLLASFLPQHPILSVFASVLIGLIPNCASSVLLTQLFTDGYLGIAALVAGLLVNAGIGLAILFRNNRPVKDSFRILVILIGISLVSGFLLQLVF